MTDAEIITNLEVAKKKGDLIGYYDILTQAGDPYGALAKGVVEANTLSGIVARGYAASIAASQSQPITLDAQAWVNISMGLMEADFIQRQELVRIGENPININYSIIRDYHSDVFGNIGLGPEAWTAYLPLQSAAEADRPAVWAQMMSFSNGAFDATLAITSFASWALIKTDASAYAAATTALVQALAGQNPDLSGISDTVFTSIAAKYWFYDVVKGGVLSYGKYLIGASSVTQIQAVTIATEGGGVLMIGGDTTNDTLIGTAFDDTLNGNGGDDTLQGNGGNDSLHGGTGFDTAVYRGRWIDYQFAAGADGVIAVSDQRAATTATHDGNDRVDGVERYRFLEDGQSAHVAAASLANVAPTVGYLSGGSLHEGFHAAGTVLATFYMSDANQYDVTRSWSGGSYTVNVSSFVAIHMLADGTAEARLTRDAILDYETWASKVSPQGGPINWMEGYINGVSQTTPWSDTPYAFSIGATDWGGLSGSRGFTLSVIDRPDDVYFPDQTPGQNGQANDGDGDNKLSTFAITEGNVAVGAVTATGTGITYHLGSGQDSILFDVNATTGAIAFKAAPDFDIPLDQGMDNHYDLTLIAVGANGTADERKVQVIVGEANHAPTDIVWKAPPAGSAFDETPGSVKENSAAGKVVGSLQAVDPDQGDTFTYSLLTESTKFEIVGDQIRVKAGANLDYETNPSWDLQIKVQDSAGAEFVKTKTVSIQDEPGWDIAFLHAEGLNLPPGARAVNLGFFSDIAESQAGLTGLVKISSTGDSFISDYDNGYYGIGYDSVTLSGSLSQIESEMDGIFAWIPEGSYDPYMLTIETNVNGEVSQSSVWVHPYAWA